MSQARTTPFRRYPNFSLSALCALRVDRGDAGAGRDARLAGLFDRARRSQRGAELFPRRHDRARAVPAHVRAVCCSRARRPTATTAARSCSAAARCRSRARAAGAARDGADRASSPSSRCRPCSASAAHSRCRPAPRSGRCWCRAISCRAPSVGTRSPCSRHGPRALDRRPTCAQARCRFPTRSPPRSRHRRYRRLPDRRRHQA